MKTVQIVLDETLLERADRLARKQGVNRSMLVREALSDYISRTKTRELEDRDRRGYQRQPVTPGEFDIWDGVAAWPDD
jgi:metal-responsive CopG/Arc/MetJ family transcriptional regulator